MNRSIPRAGMDLVEIQLGFGGERPDTYMCDIETGLTTQRTTGTSKTKMLLLATTTSRFEPSLRRARGDDRASEVRGSQCAVNRAWEQAKFNQLEIS